LTQAYRPTFDWVMVLRPTWHKWFISQFSETFPKAVSWLGMEKLNPTHRKHTSTNQKKSTTTQYTQKTKARFNRLLRHPGCRPKRRGPILVSAFHKFVTYLLRQLPTYSPGPTWGDEMV